MTESSKLNRRSFLKASAATGAASITMLAGCTGGSSGSSGGNNGGGSSGDKPSFDGWLDGVSNYDGVTDKTGSDSVTVKVGSKANGGNFGFDPAAIKISKGTKVTFQWTGKGGAHNVVDKNDAFESKLTAESGHTFTHTFSKSGTYKYYCEPHKSLGMKAVIEVE